MAEVIRCKPGGGENRPNAPTCTSCHPNLGGTEPQTAMPVRVGRKRWPSAWGVLAWPVLFLVLLVEAAWLSSCVASTEAKPKLPEQVILPEETLVEAPRTREREAMHPKLDSSLNQLLDAYQREGEAGARTFAGERGLVLDGQRVEVIIVTAPEAVEAVTEAVAGLRGEVQGHYEGLVEARVPVEALASLAELPEVQRIRVPQRAAPP